jgi:O-antigen/teichoic acid export membrane protein
MGAHRKETALSNLRPGPRRLADLMKYFGTGVIDQVMLSGASFVIGFLMIRFTSDADYGYFVLAQSAILLMLSAQGAWLLGPMSALAPAKTPETKRLMIGAIATSQTRFLRRVTPIVLAAIAAGYFLRQWSATAAWVAAATAIAVWPALQREYQRSALLIYSRPHQVFHADIAYALIVLVGVTAAALLNRYAGIFSIVVLFVANWGGVRAQRKMLAADPGWTTGNATPFLQEIAPLGLWSAVGAVTYWLFAQSYNYILASRLDLSAVASVNAARLVLMPLQVFAIGINRLLMPVASNWLAEYKLIRTLKRLSVLTVGIVIVDFVYFGLAWSVRDWLVGTLMHKTIADRDRLLILWALIALIFVIREVLQAVLFALKQVKSMAWSVGLSAAAALGVMWFGIAWWGVAAVLIGQVVGECINLIFLSWLIWDQVSRARATAGTAA